MDASQISKDVEQVLYPAVAMETDAGSYLFTKLVTFVFLMVWLVLTCGTYYFRAKTIAIMKDAFTIEFLVGMMTLSLAGPVFAFLLKGSGIGVLALSLSTITAFFLFFAYLQHYKETIAIAPSVQDDSLSGMCKAPARRTSASLIMSNIGLLICVGCALPLFYFCANAVIRRENPVTVYDQQLLNTDKFLLGWLFPEGQLSLYLDQSPSLSPATTIGSIVTHFLSVVYLSYYFYGYFTIGITAIIWLYFFAHQGQSRRTEKFWRACQHVATTWTLSFMVTFLLNTIVPARSPRLFIKDKFTHPVFPKATSFSKGIANTVHRDDTYGSFPSGHVGETLSVALAAKAAGKKYQSKFLSVAGNVVLVISFPMAAATLWLRYHYFTDVLIAIVVASGSELLTEYCEKIVSFFFSEQVPLASKTPCFSPALLPQTSLTMFTVEEKSQHPGSFPDFKITSAMSSSIPESVLPHTIEDAAHEA